MAAPAPTQAVDIAQRCADETEAIGSAFATDFACLPDGTVVAEVGDEPTVVGSSAEIAAAANAFVCGVTGELRTIVDHLHSTNQFCVIYGQRNPQTGAVVWDKSVTLRLTANLGNLYHRLDFRHLSGGDAFTTLSGDAVVYQHPNPLSMIDRGRVDWEFDNFGAPQLLGSFTFGGWDPNAGSGPMFIRLENLHVVQSNRSFSIDIPQTISTHRFLCNWVTDQCSWPNGQEAGFVGAGR